MGRRSGEASGDLLRNPTSSRHADTHRVASRVFDLAGSALVAGPDSLLSIDADSRVASLSHDWNTTLGHGRGEGQDQGPSSEVKYSGVKYSGVE